MGKDEFLRGLEEALRGEVPAEVIRENLRYYDEYITGEAGKGIPEQEVIRGIGDPRLTARTIIDSTVGVEGSYQEFRSSRGPFYREEEETVYGDDPRDTRKSFHVYDLNKWYWKLLGILLVVLILILIFVIVSGIFSLLLPLLPILLIAYLVLLFARGMRR